jgi:hypothetical protein
MFAVCMFCSGSINDIVVRADETEGEGDACGEGEGEDEGGDEGIGGELFIPLALHCYNFVKSWL